MVTFLDLPFEIHSQIADLLLLPELQNLSTLSPRFVNPCKKALAVEQKLKQMYCHVDQNNCNFNSFFGLWDEISRMGIASYIEVIEIHYLNLNRDQEVTNLGRTANDIQRIENAAWRCAVLDPSEIDSLKVHQAFYGNEDALLAILLPQMSSLGHLSLPANFEYSSNLQLELHMEWTKTVISRLAKASIASPVALPRLRRVDLTDNISAQSVDLDLFAPFLALPSLRVLKISCCIQLSFEWPESLPKSRVQSIFLNISSVTLIALYGLLKGIQGPCDIRQSSGNTCNAALFLESHETFTSCFIDEVGQVFIDGHLHQRLEG